MSWKIKEKNKERLRKEKSLVKPGNRSGLSAVLVYPNTYSVGMGNLGFQKVYAMINAQDNASCDRAFLPDMEESRVYERQNIPILSFENGIPLSKFDIVAFSITYELDYINAIKILGLANIPLKQRDRGSKDPFILMGGVCPTFNPEPLVMFADAFVIGEGEGPVPEFFRNYDRNLSKTDLLKKLAGITGMYVPSGYVVQYLKDGSVSGINARKGFPERVRRTWIKDMDGSPTATVISSPDAVFGNMRLIEINRGCGRHCRFCAAGYLYRPPRPYKTEAIKKEIDKGIEQGKKIGLVGSACCDHPGIVELARYVVESGGRFSISSLRLDAIPEELLKLLVSSGHKTLSVAPEAATERLRSAINKPLDDKELMEAVGKIFSMGIKNLKLYLLIGLPSETVEDVEAIQNLAREILSIRDKHSIPGSKGLITLSVNPFIPKPFTPFQWMGMEDLDSIKRKLRQIKKGLKGMEGIKLIYEKPGLSLIQALLSRGDRRTGELLLKCLRHGSDWQNVLQGDPGMAGFYANRNIRLTEILPWGVLDLGLNEDFLSNEFNNFSRGVETPPCPTAACRRCGAFDCG